MFTILTTMLVNRLGEIALFLGNSGEQSVSSEADERISSVQLLSRVLLSVTPRTAPHQASLSITNSWRLLKLMSIKSAMPSNYISKGLFYQATLGSVLVLIRNASEQLAKMTVKLLSRVRLFATPWTVAYRAPPSMGLSRQECWSGLPFSSPGDLPDLGIEPGSPHCRQMLYRLSHQGSPEQLAKPVHFDMARQMD